MSGDEKRKDKRIMRLKGYLLYGAEKFKVALLCNVQRTYSGNIGSSEEGRITHVRGGTYSWDMSFSLPDSYMK